MGTELRYPNITAQTEKEQLVQLRSYLHQLVDQLQYALDNGGTSAGNIASSSYEEISSRISVQYLPRSAFSTFSSKIEKAIAENSNNIEKLIADLQDVIDDLQGIIDDVGKLVFDGEEWISLGLSDGVSEPKLEEGALGGAGCYYKVCAGEKHIYVAFNCAFTYWGGSIQVNAEPIPLEYRPSRNVYAICATDERAVARILVNQEGNIFVDWLQILTTTGLTVSATVKWIDGYIDYWTDTTHSLQEENEQWEN